MKKKLFLMAAMLLASIGAFAQSNNNPQRGDVNGDGKVDVADITAVISIMKNGGSEEAVTGITLDKSSLTLSANGTGAIKATISPSNATSQGVTWTSDDPSTATVTAVTVSGENATVTWKKAGTVTITAKAVGDDSKKATCTVTCLVEGVVVYYWYVGQTDPSTMTSISPVVTDTSSPGWRLIGNNKPTSSTFTSSNMLWDGINNPIDFARSYSYIAIPYQPLQMYDDTGGDGMFYTIQNNGNPITISGVQYYIYKSDYKTLRFGMNIYNK